jgi:hypothetical protein
MTFKFISSVVVVFCGLASLVTADESSIQIRSILNNPGSPESKFYVGKPGDAMVELKLVEEGLGEPQKVQVENGNLNLFSSATVDKNNPKASLAATIKVPTGPGAGGSMIIIILPAAKGAEIPFSGIAIGDDAKSFPWGDSKAVNLTPVDFAIEIGDQKLQLPAGKITPVPKATKLDEYNRAGTNFYYKQGNQWVVAAEHEMQYVNGIRRLFLIYKTPTALAPDVRTIMDKQPVVPDEKGSGANH